MTAFLDLATKRLSQYHLGSKAEHSIEEIAQYLAEVANQAPSAMNIQASRLVVLQGEDHKKFWELIKDTQKNVLSEDMFDWFMGVYNGAVSGLGTVLFFEDRAVYENFPNPNPTAREKIKMRNSAIIQYGTWLALTDLGYGASMQHNNLGFEEGYDRPVRELFDLPDTWEMTAQMPFGSIETPDESKEKISLETQLRLL
ncbi:MAG TPA: nitroreductase [Bacteroidales bacterium]|nr:nitroreductase [Bacteroidales bacterium]